MTIVFIVTSPSTKPGCALVPVAARPAAVDRWNQPRNHALPPQRGQRRSSARPTMRRRTGRAGRHDTAVHATDVARPPYSVRAPSGCLYRDRRRPRRRRPHAHGLVGRAGRRSSPRTERLADDMLEDPVLRDDLAAADLRRGGAAARPPTRSPSAGWPTTTLARPASPVVRAGHSATPTRASSARARDPVVDRPRPDRRGARTTSGAGAAAGDPRRTSIDALDSTRRAIDARSSAGAGITWRSILLGLACTRGERRRSASSGSAASPPRCCSSPSGTWSPIRAVPALVATSRGWRSCPTSRATSSPCSSPSPCCWPAPASAAWPAPGCWPAATPC